MATDLSLTNDLDRLRRLVLEATDRFINDITDPDSGTDDAG